MRPAVPEAVLADPLAAVRDACREVSTQAHFVKIDHNALEVFAGLIPEDEVRQTPPLHLPRSAARAPDSRRKSDKGRPQACRAGSRAPPGDSPLRSEEACAYVLTLNAVNFGSGYFPELHKRPGHSGFRMIEACLLERFEQQGPFPPAELEAISASDCMELFEQNPASAGTAELMELFARAWNDLGRAVGASFEAYARAGGTSAQAGVRRLLEMPLYRDISALDAKPVPFLKRAQLTISDLAALPGEPLQFDDLADLTLFADNLVPHVLRLDRVLRYDPELLGRIESGIPLAWNSREEIEIRAGAVHATECLARHTGLQPRELDAWLWTRGSEARYKAVPRHRARCPFY